MIYKIIETDDIIMMVLDEYDGTFSGFVYDKETHIDSTTGIKIQEHTVLSEHYRIMDAVNTYYKLIK